jgi:hypothetical protein
LFPGPARKYYNGNSNPNSLSGEKVVFLVGSEVPADFSTDDPSATHRAGKSPRRQSSHLARVWGKAIVLVTSIAMRIRLRGQLRLGWGPQGGGVRIMLDGEFCVLVALSAFP